MQTFSALLARCEGNTVNRVCFIKLQVNAKKHNLNKLFYILKERYVNTMAGWKKTVNRLHPIAIMQLDVQFIYKYTQGPLSSMEN